MGVVNYPANTQITKHFNSDEFKCPHCGVSKISKELVNKLEELFDVVHASKCIISSGYRCPYYDKEQNGFAGRHSEGLAVDCCFYDKNGKIIVASDLGEAICVANTIAPEHLELCVDDPFSYLEKVRCAGSVFLGRYCPEALGDYYAGPNHTLPTGGTARFSSALSVDDFVKKIQYIYYDRESMLRSAENVNRFAAAEGLTGHGRSVMIRTEGEGQ